MESDKERKKSPVEVYQRFLSIATADEEREFMRRLNDYLISNPDSELATIREVFGEGVTAQ